MALKLFEPNDHSEKQVVILQHFGLGDLFFIEPIYRHYDTLGYQVIAPVDDESIWIKDYIPYVAFKRKSQFKYSYETVEQPNDGRLHVPLRFAHPLYRGYELHYGDDKTNWMRDKYLFLGLDEELWRTMKLERKDDKETELFNQLGITGEYNFINEYFGGSFERVEIKPKNGLQNIYLKKVPGFTLLDWRKVIESAANIYTVETSILWVIEAMDTAAKELHLYPRMPFLPNVDYVKSYMRKNWIFHNESNM